MTVDNLEMDAPHETVHRKLQDLVANAPLGMNYADRKKLILCVSREDTPNLEEGISRGCFGVALRDAYFVKGLQGALPCFLGHNVVWFAEKTALRSLSDLSKEELISTIESQQRTIDILWENRQRL